MFFLLVHDLPDLIAMRYGLTYEKFEVKPGIQIGGGLAPAKISRGQQTRITFILQNALDVQVEGKIHLVVPSKKGMFSRTYLSTISPVSFTLEPTEVEMLEIPIQSDPQTPSGSYEVLAFVEGKSREKGKRVRGAQTDSGWTKALAKSVAISAVLLPLFGGISVYAPSREVKVAFSVSEEISKETRSAEINRKKLWTTIHSKNYPPVKEWVKKGVEIVQTDRGAFDHVTSRCRYRLSSIAPRLSLSREENEEWLAWTSLLLADMIREGAFLELVSTNLTENLTEKGGIDTSELVFQDEIVDSLSDDDIINQLASIGTMAIVDILSEGKKSGNTIAQFCWSFVRPSFIRALSVKENVTEDYFGLLACLVYFALKKTDSLFPNSEEKKQHLTSVENIVSTKKEITEKVRKRINSQISEIRGKG